MEVPHPDALISFPLKSDLFQKRLSIQIIDLQRICVRVGIKEQRLFVMKILYPHTDISGTVVKRKLDFLTGGLQSPRDGHCRFSFFTGKNKDQNENGGKRLNFEHREKVSS